MIRNIFLSLLLITTSLFSVQFEDSYNDFKDNPHIQTKWKKRACLHLLPKDHPIKEKLDEIFLQHRAILNKDTLMKAGFDIKFSQPRSFVKVVSHPILPGYLLKVYLDSEARLKKGKEAFKWLILRCEGAKKIKDVIKKRKIKHFKVPNKWLYPLPLEPVPGLVPQPFVLIVEDMQLCSKEENINAWKNIITEKHLEELYIIIRHAKGSSYRPDNIAYSIDGKFAFIDTEYPYRKPDYNSIVKYLSYENQCHWKSLVK